MTNLITDPAQVTPKRLTEILHAKGHLPQGEVTTVEKKDEYTSTTSLIVRFLLDYSPDASTTAPRAILLKMTRPQIELSLSPGVGTKEVVFYNNTVGTPTESWVPHCYDAVYDAESDRFHLLLEDLTDSHFQTEWPLPPLQAYCEQVIDALSSIHACWWNSPQLETVAGTIPNEETITAMLEQGHLLFASFVDFMGDRLSLERRAIYERILATLPRLSRRYTEGKNLTLLQGDSHFWNVLFPHDLEKDTVRLIDWQSCEIGVGPADLAYMIALHWFPERRARLEMPLLRRYHDRLLADGITAYSWEDCLYDYRLSAINNLLIPPWQWFVKLPASLWWHHLERGFLAFEDLQCAELLNA